MNYNQLYDIHCPDKITLMYKTALKHNEQNQYIILAHYYRLTNETKSNHEILSELSSIISLACSNVSSVVYCELLIIAAKEASRINNNDQQQHYLKQTADIDLSTVLESQKTYIKNNLVIRNQLLELKGKEGLLLKLLREAPREKYELIEAIYKSPVDIAKKEKSFKVLLGRVKKKLPFCIYQNIDGNYALFQ